MTIQNHINEIKKPEGYDLISIDGIFREENALSIAELINHRYSVENRARISNYINGLKGKKIVFYNYKNGKNLRKERIAEGCQWKNNFGAWEFWLKGTKKDYFVNLEKSIGYFDIAPKYNRTISPLDPYGEEIWDSVKTLNHVKLFEDFNTTKSPKSIWDSMSKEEKTNFIKRSFPKISQEHYDIISEQGYGTLDYYLRSNFKVVNQRLLAYK